MAQCFITFRNNVTLPKYLSYHHPKSPHLVHSCFLAEEVRWILSSIFSQGRLIWHTLYCVYTLYLDSHISRLIVVIFILLFLYISPFRNLGVTQSPTSESRTQSAHWERGTWFMFCRCCESLRRLSGFKQTTLLVMFYYCDPS